VRVFVFVSVCECVRGTVGGESSTDTEQWPCLSSGRNPPWPPVRTTTAPSTAQQSCTWALLHAVGEQRRRTQSRNSADEVLDGRNHATRPTHPAPRTLEVVKARARGGQPVGVPHKADGKPRRHVTAQHRRVTCADQRLLARHGGKGRLGGGGEGRGRPKERYHAHAPHLKPSRGGREQPVAKAKNFACCSGVSDSRTR
jgi:hypothetical protein